MTLASWTWAHWFVLVAWLTLAGYGLWLALSKRSAGAPVAMSADGHQEALLLVRDSHTSVDIVVRAGRPVRLKFRRDESAFRSERVVISGFNKIVDVPSHGTATVILHPRQPGTFPFECTRGAFKGRLIVESNEDERR